MVPNPQGLINPVHQQIAPPFAPVTRVMLLSPSGGMAMAPPLPVSPSPSKELNMPLDQFWCTYFDHLFNSGIVAPHTQYFIHYPYGRCESHRLLWELIPVGAPPASEDGIVWCEHSDTAKVRFHCSNPNCEKKGSGWTSMNGTVQFWWRIIPHLITGVPTGYVAFKLFGQKCSSNSCHEFEPAMWYQEEVEKVLWNAFVVVRRQLDPHFSLGSIEGIRQSRTRPKKPHEQDKCEACANGSCPSIRSRVASDCSSKQSIEYQEQAVSRIEATLHPMRAECQE